jgi:hypothetical protein
MDNISVGGRDTVGILKPLMALWVTALVVGPPPLSAQENACDVPLVVTRFVASSGTVELVKDLTAKDLTVRVGGAPSAVENASVDGGGKRIALILDASKKVPKDEWKLETEMAISLSEHARPEDRFAFFLVGVDRPAGPLLTPGEVQKRVGEVASSRPDAADGSERIYDALLAAAKSLDPPQFGDAIFLFGHPKDSGSKATPEEIQELILKDRLRFYAMSFADPLRGKYPPRFDPNKPLPANLGLEQADKISHATGYFFSFHSVEDLDPSQIVLLKGFLGDLYAGIAEPYRVKIDANVADKTALDLLVTNSQARNIRQSDVHYPHFIYQCIAR